MAEKDDSLSDSDRVDSILAEFVAALDAGQPRDRAELYSNYPEYAAEFDLFFLDYDLANRDLNAPAESRPSSQVTPTSGAVKGDSADTLQPTLPLGKAAKETSVPEGLRRFGDYEILEEIASGGMGVVFRAKQLSLNRVVALKMILRGPAATTEDLHRFRAEAEAAAALDHPNIITIHEVGQHEGSAYFSMKLIEGPSLAQYLANPRRRLDTREDQRASARLMAQVARAVHYAHQHGILHRDLKPGNILLSGQWPTATGPSENGSSRTSPTTDHGPRTTGNVVPYVTDFGLAKRIEAESDLTRTGVILGTPGYMAPEQAAGKQIAPTADIFSLGAVLYHLLSGQRAFHGDNPMATLWQVQFQEPPPPRSLVPALDRDLDTICMKCLRKNPADRYTSSEEVADDLERWLANEPIRARPLSSFEQITSWARRQPARLSVALSLGVVLTTLLGTFLWVQHRQRQDAAEVAKNQVRKYEECLESAKKAFPHRIDVQRWLAECPKPLCDARWDALMQRARELPLVISHLDDRVVALEYSPDGSKIAAVIFPQSIRVWSTDTGALLNSVDGEERVTCLAFSPDSQTLAFAGRGKNKVVRLWHLSEDPVPLSLDPHAAIVRALAFSPDGTLLASGSGGFEEKTRCVRVCEVHSGKCLAELPNPTGAVRFLAFAPNGTQLASSSFVEPQLKNPLMVLWDWHKAEKAWSTEEPALRISFDRQGRYMAALSGNHKDLMTWNLETKTILARWSCDETVDGFRFVGDNLSGATPLGKLFTWSPTTGNIIHCNSFKVLPALMTAISPDGKQAAFATFDKSLVLWDCQTDG